MLKIINGAFNFFLIYKPTIFFLKKNNIILKNFLFIFVYLKFFDFYNYFFHIIKKKKNIITALKSPNRNKKAQSRLIIQFYILQLKISYQVLNKNIFFYKIPFIILFLKLNVYESKLLLLYNRRLVFFFYEMIDSLKKNNF